MGSISRHSTIKKRRNFLPSLLITLLLWSVVSGIVYFIEPEAFAIIPLFFILFFFALLFTFSLIFGNKNRGLIISLAITFFALLRYFGVGNILNLLLIAGLVVTAELYLSRT